ncbi:ANTAR domain-containing response regulator [Brochothrix thermosphacta]|uniref:ANTAR domain-containing response regulator n=1 Tax=Brochothrix thermosphacta TaxID=2756 RepID=UPI00083FBDBF|nr:response regulator [Brochothrix thermosphacta]ODJ72405.1 Fis family transcriptional regulator [Brochothrix thermosphacta]
MNGRIVVVDDEPITRMDIRDVLEEAGYDVVAEASDGFEAIEACKKHRPDLIIIDIQMPILDGLKAGKKILADQLAQGIIFLSAFSGVEHTERAKKAGAIGYLVKPLHEKSLIPTVEMAIAKGQETTNLIKKIEKLSLKLDERKIIEKAKGCLMLRDHMTEDDAYKTIRELSMNKRCRMSEIAELIVMTDE